MKLLTLKNYLRKFQYSRLITPLVLLLAAIILLLFSHLKHSTVAINIDSYKKIDSLFESGQHNVVVSTDVLYYTGCDYEVNKRSQAKIFYTLQDDICYFFIISNEKIPASFPKSNIVKGQKLKAHLIVNSSLYDKLLNNMAESLNYSKDDLASKCSNVIISQYDYSHGFITFYQGGLFIVCGLTIINLLIILMVIINPLLSTPVMNLRYYGNVRELFMLAEEEFGDAVPAGRKDLFITDTFLIFISASTLDIIPLNSIVWMYKANEFHIQKNRFNVLQALCIVTDRKKQYKIHHVQESVSDRIISDLQSRFPEIMVGNSK